MSIGVAVCRPLETPSRQDLGLWDVEHDDRSDVGRLRNN